MTMSPRLAGALAAYAALALLATVTLDGHFRAFLWLFLAALALKSWIADKQSKS